MSFDEWGIDTSVEDSEMGMFVTNVFVIHNDGIVLLSREYKQEVLQIEPQLIGGLLTAIIQFIKNTTINKCPCGSNHRLTDVGMSCARWVVSSRKPYNIAMLIMNTSPLLQDETYHILDKISEEIIYQFEMINTYGARKGKLIDLFMSQSDTLGKKVDNIVFSNIESIGNITYREGISVDVSEYIKFQEFNIDVFE